jgi:hypothetical protein
MESPRINSSIREQRLNFSARFVSNDNVRAGKRKDQRRDPGRILSINLAGVCALFWDFFCRSGLRPRTPSKIPAAGYFDTFIGVMDPGTAMQKYRHLYFFGNLNQYSSEQRASLKYFNAKGLSEIDSQGAYVLQEWIRP